MSMHWVGEYLMSKGEGSGCDERKMSLVWRNARLQNARSKVNQAFEALYRQGYIYFEQQELHEQMYVVPQLTQKGRKAIQAGKYLWLAG